jgi:hypothetical protein
MPGWIMAINALFATAVINGLVAPSLQLRPSPPGTDAFES